eukprot:scaffold45461_cov62-Phaeocystis_antarctica.AAC.8
MVSSSFCSRANHSLSPGTTSLWSWRSIVSAAASLVALSCSEPDGSSKTAGPCSCGKSTVMNSLSSRSAHSSVGRRRGMAATAVTLGATRARPTTRVKNPTGTTHTSTTHTAYNVPFKYTARVAVLRRPRARQQERRARNNNRRGARPIALGGGACWRQQAPPPLRLTRRPRRPPPWPRSSSARPRAVDRRGADDVHLELGHVLVGLDLAAHGHDVALPLRAVDDGLVRVLVRILDGLELARLHAHEDLGHVVEGGEPLVGAAVARHAGQHVSVDARLARPATLLAVEAAAVLAHDLALAGRARRVPDALLALGRRVDLGDRGEDVEVRRLLAGADARLLQVEQAGADRVAVGRVAARVHGEALRVGGAARHGPLLQSRRRLVLRLDLERGARAERLLVPLGDARALEGDHLALGVVRERLGDAAPHGDLDAHPAVVGDLGGALGQLAARLAHDLLRAAHVAHDADDVDVRVGHLVGDLRERHQAVSDLGQARGLVGAQLHDRVVAQAHLVLAVERAELLVGHAQLALGDEVDAARVDQLEEALGGLAPERHAHLAAVVADVHREDLALAHLGAVVRAQLALGDDARLDRPPVRVRVEALDRHRAAQLRRGEVRRRRAEALRRLRRRARELRGRPARASGPGAIGGGRRIALARRAHSRRGTDGVLPRHGLADLLAVLLADNLQVNDDADPGQREGTA